MTKGLAAILEKLKTNPSATLVDRYLALLADLGDEDRKVSLALDLAELLSSTKPATALRVAHMVYKHDPANMRALDVMITSLTNRGRFAKAEVIRNERQKLGPEGLNQKPQSAKAAAVRPPALFADADQKSARPAAKLAVAKVPGPVPPQSLSKPKKFSLDPPSPAPLPAPNQWHAELSVENQQEVARAQDDPPRFRLHSTASQVLGLELNAPLEPSPLASRSLAEFTVRSINPPILEKNHVAEVDLHFANRGELTQAQAAVDALFLGENASYPPKSGDSAHPTPPATAAPLGRIQTPLGALLAFPHPQAAELAPEPPPAAEAGFALKLQPVQLDPGRSQGRDPGATPRTSLEASVKAALSERAAPGGDGDETPQREVAPSADTPEQRQEVPTQSEGQGGHAAMIQLFDYYWRAGMQVQARELLVQTAPFAGQAAWWTQRQALTRMPKEAPSKGSAQAASSFAPSPDVTRLNPARNAAPHAEPAASLWEGPLAEPAASLWEGPLAEAAGTAAPAPSTPSMPLATQAARQSTANFWTTIRAELGRIEQPKAMPPLPAALLSRPKSGLGSTANSRSAPVNPAAVRDLAAKIAGLDQRLGAPTQAELTALLAVKWELMQGLYGDAPDASCALLLEELALQRATPGFWGLYLDALLASGSARKALVEVRRLLTERPRLMWARVASQRLPRLWQGLAVRGFVWTEDEGVNALLTKLARRPTPLLRGLVAAPWSEA